MKKLTLMIGTMATLLACAETRTWLANVDGDWNTPGMWSGGTAPGTGDTADFSNLTGNKTITLPTAATVAAIVYEPTVGSATNKLTLAGAALTLATSLTIGEKALLETTCDVKASGHLYTYGLGEWRIAKALMGSDSNQHKLFQRAGRITLATNATMSNAINLHPGTTDATLSPAEFVVEDGATVNFNNVNDFELAQADNSRSVFTMNGGTLLPRNASNAGCFINALAKGSVSTMNINSGLVDGTGKQFYYSFRGTGVVNQTGGVMKWHTIFGALNTDTAPVGTYNLLGGELWLATGMSRNSRPAYLNVGNAKIVKTGSGNLDVTSPLTVTDRFEIDVTNSAYTCNISCRMEGTGGLVKSGPGTLTIYSEEKKFTGPLVVSNGVLQANANMPGNNAVTVAGGTLQLYTNRPYTFSSLTLCGTGTLTYAPSARVTLPATARFVTVKDNATLQMRGERSCFVADTALRVEGNGKVSVAEGETAFFPSVTTNGAPVANGVYTSASFLTGGGALVVGNCAWNGAASDGQWSSSGNWQGGVTPFDALGGVDLSAATGTITLDNAVTNTTLVFTPETGATLTNRSSSVLSLDEGSIITVGTGSTLVLDGDVCLLKGTVFKRGGGTLVFARNLSAGTVTTAPFVYLRVQEGRCVVEGAVTDVSFYSGLLSSSELTEPPEVVFGPESSLSGVTSLIGLGNDVGTDPAPGNGLFTQLGGTVRPSSSWTRAVTVALARNDQAAATGTYHLVNGTLEIPTGKIFGLGEGTAFGIFTQDGGESRIHAFGDAGAARGEINLNGGRMALGSLINGNPLQINFNGGTFAPLNAALNVYVPWALSGETTFDAPTSSTLTFSRAPTGTGSFTKTGTGTLILQNGLSQKNDIAVEGGTVALNVGSTAGSISLAADATINLTDLNSATNFVIAGTVQAAGGAIYTSNNCARITGGGSLLVGELPGTWNGLAGDGKWSSVGNWSGNVIPNGGTVNVDLSAAAGTLVFDAGNLTVGSISFETVGAGTLTNAAPAGSAGDILSIAADGVITVGEGETLVLDHPLCVSGTDTYKRGKGTLVLRQGMRSIAGRENADNYFSIEEGIVINEGCVTNVIPIPGANDRSDPANVPQFVNRGDGASMVGRTFISAMHFRGNPINPGNGLFVQDGGLVAPNTSWSGQGVLGFAQSGATVGGTGTYHLVSGTLRIPSGKTFNMHNSNGFGVFTQDGGLFEHNGTFDMYNGIVTLNGGTMRLNAVNNVKPIILGGGFFRPLPVAFTFASSFELTGDGAFEIDAGKTMTLNAANPLRGAAPLNKVGEGVLTITGTEATMTGPVNVNAGTLRLTGCLPNSTNMIVAADATLEVATGTASFNAQTALRIETGGKLNLTGTGAVSVDALWLGGVPRMGHGRRYGSSSHAGAVDIVDDRFFTGTGVLIVTGRSLGDGTTIIVR